MAVPQAILPIFLLIVLGYFLRRRGTLTAESNKAFGELAFKLFMPMVLFIGMAKAPLHDGLNTTILAAYFIPALIIFAGVNLVAHWRIGHPTPFGLTAAFGNNGLMGIALVASLFGNPGLVLLFTILAVHSLLLFSFQSLYNSLAGDEPFSFKTLVGSLANPMIIGLLLGVLLNLSGLTMPLWAEHLTTWLAQAALPCALIVLGGNLAGYRLRPSIEAVGITVAKLLIMPVLVLVTCMIMGISGTPRAVLMLMAATPCGLNVLGFSRTQEDVRKTSSAICLSTLVSAATMPMWMWVESWV
ncbi:AEC family transporter [Pseudomonas syringae]|uniref:AEC family transporter n=1 Tax=Pseudomonas quasicaspiana TaxID=2829821 RepID=UPI000419AB01|nr:AEC family transporter [Pseudomonas quasicaspiana]MCD5978392.1 AEC family transporter [Pseudomonas quasicaspiana]MCQ2995628.1 AEC family transporter [Pseudomonas syringae]MCQ3032316.1 AEC family transporter [Pseudomonas syringae]MDG6402613.1 AEC family transporter [Pseudomonas quasicaspiana]